MDQVGTGLNFVSKRGAMARMGPPQEPPASERPGRSASAPGQMAKIAVAAARAAGAELPENAQGIAASGIARGADPSSLFAALIPPPVSEPEPVPDPVADPMADPGGDVVGGVSPPDAPVTDPVTLSGYATNAGAVTAAQTSAEAALDILTGGDLPGDPAVES